MYGHKIGFVRGIDKLGRLCIPNELRQTYGMDPGVGIEIVPVQEGILLRTASSRCSLCQKAKNLVSAPGNSFVCQDCLRALFIAQKDAKFT